MTLTIGTIEEEAALCRAAWAAHPEATYAWHCHHGVLCELLIDAPEVRISFLLREKAEAEQARRLRLFRPAVSPEVAEAGRICDAACAEARWIFDALYDETRRICGAACDEAGRIYEAARSEAGASYYKAWRIRNAACSEALRIWDAACAEARRIRDAACDEAWRIRGAAYAEAHARECPDCPWDGKTVFPEEGTA